MKNKPNQPSELSPMDCKGEGDVVRLQSDNHSLTRFWILTDGYHVTLAEQRSGEGCTQEITIPKSKFDALVRWYIKKQKLRKRGGLLEDKR